MVSGFLLELRSNLAINFYADESSQNAHRYLVLGIIAVRTANVAKIVEEYNFLNQRFNWEHEVKWTKVHNHPIFKAWTDKSLDFIAMGKMKFTALVLDTSTFDHEKYNEGDSEIGFNKILYQLLLHRIGRKYGRWAPIYGYLDGRTTIHTPERLRQMINSGLAKIDIHTAPFRTLEFMDSKNSPLIQAVDLLIGAVAFDKNGHSKKPNARKAKNALSEYILQIAQVKPYKWRFNIWQFEFQGNEGPQI